MSSKRSCDIEAYAVAYAAPDPPKLAAICSEARIEPGADIGSAMQSAQMATDVRTAIVPDHQSDSGNAGRTAACPDARLSSTGVGQRSRARSNLPASMRGLHREFGAQAPTHTGAEGSDNETISLLRENPYPRPYLQ